MATEDKAALMDSLILCKFLRGVFGDLFTEGAELLRLVTGWNVTGEELRTTARRIVSAKKLYNQREGWTLAEDTLPKRFLTEAMDGNQAVLPRLRLEKMIEAYYQVREWDEDGRVPQELIRLLELGEMAS